METHVVSGQISTSVSGNSVNTSVSGNTVQLAAGTTVQLSPSGVFVMSGTVNTSVSGNVVNISGAQIQTSISGNVIQASISGNAISISGDIIMLASGGTFQTSVSGNVINTSISGNVLTLNPASTPSASTTWVFINTGFILPQNMSGGVDLPDIGTFVSGLPIVFMGFSGMSTPTIWYGTSGYIYHGVQGTSGLSPSHISVGTIPFINWSDPVNGFGFGTLFPFTNTSQIKVITNISGATLMYGGFI